MNDKIDAVSAIFLPVTPARMWDALTNPATIRQYLFGTEAESDWKVGSNITYRGEYGGVSYADKAIIVDLEENRRLVTRYWSSMSGLPDAPENYVGVRYEIEEMDGRCELRVTQEDNKTDAEAEQRKKDWGTDGEKWGRVRNGEIPLWVADMDYAVSPVVTEALTKRIAHPVFGYTDTFYTLSTRTAFRKRCGERRSSSSVLLTIREVASGGGSGLPRRRFVPTLWGVGARMRRALSAFDQRR